MICQARTVVIIKKKKKKLRSTNLPMFIVFGPFHVISSRSQIFSYLNSRKKRCCQLITSVDFEPVLSFAHGLCAMYLKKEDGQVVPASLYWIHKKRERIFMSH